MTPPPERHAVKTAFALDIETAARLAGLNSPIALWIANVDCELVYFNQAFTRFSGQPAAAGLGTGWRDMLHPDDIDNALTTFQIAVAAQARYIGEYRLRRNDGVYRWIQAHGMPYRDHEGGLLGYIGASVDITDLMLAREREAALREHLELAVAGAKEGLFNWPDMTKPEFWCSPRAYELAGYAPGEVPSTIENLFTLIHPDDRERIQLAIADAMATQQDYDVQYRILGKDGTYRWYRVRGTVSQTSAGTLRMSGSTEDINDHIDAMAEIARLQSRVERAMTGATSILWDWNSRDGRMWISDSMKSVLGYLPGEDFSPTDTSFKSAMHPEDWPHVRAALIAHLKQRTPFECEHRLRHKSGEYRWFRAQGAGQWDERGRAVRLSGSIVDIHDRKFAERALAEERTKAVVTLATITDAVISTDADGVIDFLNPAAERLLGRASTEVLGQPFVRTVQLVAQQSRVAIPDPVASCIERDHSTSGRDALLINAAGIEYAIEYSSAPLHQTSDVVSGAVVVLRNVTEERRLAQAISFQATHDSMTGLVNRLEFERRLQRVLQSVHDGDDRHAFAYLDLDKFKIVNDTCGHGAGDELLRQISVIMADTVRKRDTVARLGGDEFGILMEHCSLRQAERVAEEIREKIANFRFRWNEHVFSLGVSVGLIQINDANGDLATLFKQADAACYSAKTRGRNQVHVYYPGDRTIERRRGDMEWVTALNTALDTRGFQLHVQPTRALSDSNAPPYVEVLIRYPDGDTMRLPGEFLPAAERCSLSVRIDCWVVQNFLTWYAVHSSEIDPRTLFAFNVSASSLTDDAFLSFVNRQLSSSAIPPDRLCFEFTEAAAISNMAKSINFLKTLKARGCSFSLDDFGSGLSSFGYLRSMPIDFLKIDGPFVRNCVEDPIDLAIVKSVNELGHVIGVKTIAEFVETEAIAAQMLKINVDYAQGYGISRSLPLTDYLASLKK